jgi:Mrp family chromosome partitioning ATPase
MLAVSDCRLLARWVDGFLMVISAHKTSRKLLEEALNLMDPNKTVGIVFNRDDSPLTRYYGQYYQVESSGRKSVFASAGAL